MRDFLPEDVRRRQFVIGVTPTYQKYGFEPLETPAVSILKRCKQMRRKKATG